LRIDSDIGEIARRQLADYDAHRPGRIFEDLSFRLSIDEAYAVQSQTAQLRVARGETIGGYKIGCLSEAIRRQLNVDRPVFGRLFTHEFFRSDCRLAAADYDGLAIEGELAVRLAQDIPDASRVSGDPAQFIAAAFVTIELHNHVFRAPAKTAQELIANNAFHAGVVLPLVEPRLASHSFSEPISVCRNGEALGTAIPALSTESVLSAIRQIARFAGRLRKGQILLTGSPLPLYRVFPGDEIEVSGPGTGRVRAGILRAGVS
jgi:2-keto-4-pentenoate hydratase